MPSLEQLDPSLMVSMDFKDIVAHDLQEQKDVFLVKLREQLRGVIQKHHEDLLADVSKEIIHMLPDSQPLQQSQSSMSSIPENDAMPPATQAVEQAQSPDSPWSVELSPLRSARSPSKSAVVELDDALDNASPKKMTRSVKGQVDDVALGDKAIATPSSATSAGWRDDEKLGNWDEESQKDFGVYCRPVRKIVGHAYFELASTGMIFGYVAFMAMEAQYAGELVGYNIGHRDFKAPPDVMWETVWLVGACLFNLFFVGELALRLLAAQAHFLWSPWLWFDSVMVCLGILNLMDSLKVSKIFELDVRVIRIVRLLRALRLVKVLKRSSALHSLFILFRSIKAAVAASVWSFILILLIILGAGLLIQQFLISPIETGDLTEEARMEVFDHFGTFSKTVVTMFELTQANWPPVCRLLMSTVGDGWGYCVVFYRCFFCFAVVNVIGAVFIAETNRVVQADDEVATITKDRAARHMRDTMRALFNRLDTDGDGLVTWETFSTAIGEDVTVAFMNTLDLNAEDCRLVFLLLDDSADGLTHDEFYEGMKNIRGGAKRIDVAILLKLVRKLQKTVDISMGSRPSRTSHNLSLLM